MKIIPTFLVVSTLLLTTVGHSAETRTTPELITRGRYLVENIGLCADCHSPRNQRGEFIPELQLKGSTLAFAPTVPMPAWAAVAPAIAGLPTMTEAQAVYFMQTGLKPDGTKARPPMPEFRVNQADATAMVAYLKSLK